jgi:hypothetical protein
MTGHKPESLFLDTSKPVGVHSRAADLTRSRERLGWEPSHTLEDGLRPTIDWYWRTHDRDDVASKLEALLNERAGDAADVPGAAAAG